MSSLEKPFFIRVSIIPLNISLDAINEDTCSFANLLSALVPLLLLLTIYPFKASSFSTFLTVKSLISFSLAIFLEGGNFLPAFSIDSLINFSLII